MSSLAEIELLVGQGQEEQARLEIEQWDTSLVQDGRLHLRLADLCEEVGLSQRLITELNLAIRDDPEETISLRRLAQAHRDAGRLDRAWRCLKNLCQREPEDVQLWLEAVQLLLEMSNRDEAGDVLSQALRHSQHPELLAQKRLLESSPQVEPDDALVGTNSPSLLARFQSLFSGREGVYARQWAKDRQNTGYTPIRQPLSHRVIQNHLQGNHTIGVYPIRLDGTVNFVALDLDLPKSLTLRQTPDDEIWQQALENLHTFALRLQAEGSKRGLTTYLEDSGGKGRHLWCFLASPLTARLARKLGQLWAEWAGALPPQVCLELFPKQASLQPDQLGNLIKLPLGIHRGSGRRAEFLDSSSLPIEDQETFLMRIKRNPKELIQSLLCQPAPNWIEELPEGEQAPEAAPAPPPYLPDSDLEFQTLMLRCVTLRTLVDRAEAQRNLTHDEALVVQHTLGYLRQGVEATNHVLAKCPDISANYYLKSPYRGNPMSCARIRARIPGTTSRLDCNCEFPPVPSYPTPILHLQGPPPEGDRALAKALLQDYQRARRHWQEAASQLLQIQTRLQGLQNQGLVQIRQTLDAGQPGCFEVD